jgi:hypothetical protein
MKKYILALAIIFLAINCFGLEVYNSQTKSNASNVYTTAVSVPPQSLHTFVVKTTGITATGSIVVQFQGSAATSGGTDFFNLSGTSVNHTISDNGSHGFYFEGKLKYVRVWIVSKSGNYTSAIINYMG